jgi:hypothetical protein
VSDEPRRRIEIPDDVARAEAVPEDLDSSLVGPYTFPSLRRRRRGAFVLAGGAIVAAAGAVGLARGMVVTASGLAILAVWHLAAAWPLAVDDATALDTANRETEFPVGHASAAVGFDGIRARPVWNVLVFSADEPPSRRGLVRVDGVDGHVVESYVEDNPAP